jgi:hypothetical protein
MGTNRLFLGSFILWVDGNEPVKPAQGRRISPAAKNHRAIAAVSTDLKKDLPTGDTQ